MCSELFISANMVQKFLLYEELIPSIERALGTFSKHDGQIVNPVRSTLPVEEVGFHLSMSCYSKPDQALSTKLITLYPGGVPRAIASVMIMYYNPEDGSLLAIIDAEDITGMRTAAASVVASKYLANPESKILGLIGSGLQAESHLKALSMLFKFDEVRVYSRNYENACVFAEKFKCIACKNAKDAVENADIICTITSSHTPVLKAEWVKTGCHINAVGANQPTMQELDAALMNNSIVYVDSKEAASVEKGDIKNSNAEIYAEIGEVINKSKEAFINKTTIFESGGIAIEDTVAAKLVYDNYKKSKVV